MIAIIPARGGSKGLPGKNIKNLCGKPLIAYSIEVAKKSKYIDRVIVTTDSKEIADVALKYGAEVPFFRPDNLASDSASAVDVYIHAAEFMRDNHDVNIEKFMVLLPTAPLRDTEDINCAVELFNSKGANTLISMKEAETPVSWYYTMENNNVVKNAGFSEENAISNRQMNSKYYIPNGAIYILDYNLLKEKRTYYDDTTIAYVMTAEKSIDIDFEFDFRLAECLMSSK